MPAPYETTGMRDTLSGYAGWFIENRVAPAAPYFVAFVLCLGMMGAMIGDTQSGPDYVMYDLDRYGVSNHGDILYRLDPVPNDDPIWVLVTDPVEYDFVMRYR